jgi:ribosome biogenesis GTPase A
MTASKPNSPSTNRTVEKKKSTMALIGNPNCGKTTLINKLIGALQTELTMTMAIPLMNK